jgi:hypothetical protein
LLRGIFFKTIGRHVSTPTKSKLAMAMVLSGCVAFLGGTAVLCHCPGPFVVAACLAVVAIALGTRRVRVLPACLCVASIAMGVYEFERERDMEKEVERIRRAEANKEPK